MKIACCLLTPIGKPWRDGHGVLRTALDKGRVAKDAVFFDPHIPFRAHRGVFLVPGFHRSLDEFPHLPCLRASSILVLQSVVPRRQRRTADCRNRKMRLNCRRTSGWKESPNGPNGNR